MSILPEYIVQQMLVKGIRAFREDGRLVDMLFRNLMLEDVDAVRSFIRDNSIDIAINYPAAPISLPSIVISLKNESESQAFLDELLQPPGSVQRTHHPFPMDEETDLDVMGGGSITDNSLKPSVIAGPYQATGGTINTVSFAQQDPFNISDPIEVDEFAVVIRAGTGAGQSRTVSSIVVNKVIDTVIVTVTTNWATIPDSTSVIEFQGSYTRGTPPIGVTGEPAKLYNSQSVVEREGSHYKVSYQLLVSGPNPEMTIFLYTIVKAIVFINREYLMRQGLMNIKISGTDFVTKPEYLPDLAYTRALIMEFDHSFDVYLEKTALAKIRMQIGVYDPNVADGSGSERVVSDVEFDL